jgi:hypothetical protein
MAVDGHRDRRDRARWRVVAAEQLAVELLKLGPHAGKRGQRGKQWIEQRGTHGTHAARVFDALQQVHICFGMIFFRKPVSTFRDHA